MTISGDDDEDAMDLDDDALASTPSSANTNVIYPATWPPAVRAVSDETLAWFKANTTDWAREIDAVLRGWIASR
jgi:hypothetical protein